MCVLQAHTYNAIGAQLCMTVKLTYLMTAYYTPSDGFTANDALVYMYMNKVLRHDLKVATVQSIYLHIGLSFQLQWML